MEITPESTSPTLSAITVETPTATSNYELERGKPIPSLNHSIVQKRLLVLIESKYATQYEVLPELSMMINKDKKVPDLAIYSPLKIDFSNDEIQMNEAPLTAIEILSPKQHLNDLVEKSASYFLAGVKSYWLVLPVLRSIFVFYSVEDSHIFTHKDILKDTKLNIQVDLSKVFK